QWRAYEFAERHFSTDDAVLCSWDGSRLDDPRIDRLARKVRGTLDPSGRRRGASPYFDSVRTPYDLIAQIHSDKIPMEESIARVTGVLVGRGPVRIRLTDEGRDRRERLIRTIESLAKEKLQLNVVVRTASIATADSQETLESEAAADAGSSALGEAPLVANLDPAGEPPAAGVDGDEPADDSGPPAESSLAELAALLPVMEPHDLLVTWQGMHWKTSQVGEFQTLIESLDSIGGEIAPKSGETAERPVIEACFQTPGTPAAVALYLSEAGRAERGAALEWLQNAAADSGIPASALHLAGSPVAGHALNTEVMKATWNPQAPATRPDQRSLFLLSGLVGGLFALWMLKSWRLALVVLGVSYYTALVSLALVPAVGAPMNMVLVTMPTLLLVTTLSVAVHIANYWRHGRESPPSSARHRFAQAPCRRSGILASTRRSERRFRW
ncbi:MAG: hypothetical protein NT069_13800, partial [Planctomycetota bacterium]|nr:hypothetical protein [Planctomycetota bacterium]